MAEEAGLGVDTEGFARALEEAKEKSRAAGKKDKATGLKFEAEATGWLQKAGVAYTDDGAKYGAVDAKATVRAILAADGFVQTTAGGEAGAVYGFVLDATSFYAESGGQVGDTGSLAAAAGGGAVAVSDCIVAAGYVLHVGEVTAGALAVGDAVATRVDYGRRGRIAPNHTMTHVLNLALRDVLGGHVDQKGSLVLADRLRFDFSNNSLVDAAKLADVEARCRAAVAAGLPVHSREVPLAAAKEIVGLRAVFGETYPDPVRVVAVGTTVDALLADPKAAGNAAHSIEFCGGTHLSNTAQAGAFALISEEGVAKGVRRIIAFTGADAARAIAEGQRLAAEVAAAGALPPAELERFVTAAKQAIDSAVIPAAAKAALRDELAGLGKRVAEAAKAAAAENKRLAASAAVAAADAAVTAGRSFLVARIDVGTDAKALAEAAAAVAAKHPAVAAMLWSVDAEKERVLAFAAVPEALAGRIAAPEWVGAALPAVGGKGGGKGNTAQGQGGNLAGVGDGMRLATEFASLKL
jgi:alanyl-tRNA synthetase